MDDILDIWTEERMNFGGGAGEKKAETRMCLNFKICVIRKLIVALMNTGRSRRND